jgi:hypothetical protein
MLFLLCTLALWGQPLARTWTEPLWPMSRVLLRVPHKAALPSDAVAVLPWLVLSNRATSSLVRLLYSAAQA